MFDFNGFDRENPACNGGAKPLYPLYAKELSAPCLLSETPSGIMAG